MEISLIVGLGNPGPQYEPTRHNAGFWFLDYIVERYAAKFSIESKFHGHLSSITVAGKKVWLLKPTTFMNRSGQAVAAVASYYKIAVDNILVAHDELDLAPGQLKLKQGGGHAGHNGLRDIISHLGSDFLRLRIGIDRPQISGRPVVDYVLGNPSKAARKEIDEAIDDAERALDMLAVGDLQKAMNRLHSRGKI
ncbi:MAG: aminoacyl-tRNA hydrolase [Thiotrichales bacterium]|nr:aminoacyl-tRNA hydrolase [Thiotrichales bacterium]MBT3613317.1 aminoacyl-tRNA hydrolase [Thiotrichales bacterium]MBT3752432.1 aminoacyl-tRNA hydrolase [Thiotrichales bacterium]MBT3836980.1 aminoacyl-tRNA hydrolase [Thiotrichales bacterium]MBT4152737.1 aminoacyl-tRNA hydrolase [Thiotrichales bacterium]